MEELGLTSLLLRSAVVVVLIVANAFFVAAEFALVSARRTRIEALAQQGDAKAKAALAALQDLNRQLSAAQLGITVASILLGYVAEDTVAVLFHQWMSGLPPALAFLGRTAVASVVAIFLVSFLHVVFGEQAPRTWAITFPEATSRWLAAPLMFFAWITRPATNLLNWSSNRVLALTGLKATANGEHRIHSPEEIVMLLKKSEKLGQIDTGDLRMIEGVFEFTEKTASDVMTPRTEIVGLSGSLTIEEAADRVAEAGRSRYPVYRSSVDDVFGIVHAKQILATLRSGSAPSLEAIAREPLFVPRTREVEDVLAEMKHRKEHMAIVLDEFGGTAGIVTMEDLLEEIVGQIYDEHDPAEAPASSDRNVLTGRMSLAEVNEHLNVALHGGSFHTVGGYVFGRLGRLPIQGDRVPVEGGAFEVLEMKGRRIAKLRWVPNGDEITPPKP